MYSTWKSDHVTPHLTRVQLFSTKKWLSLVKCIFFHIPLLHFSLEAKITSESISRLLHELAQCLGDLASENQSSLRPIRPKLWRHKWKSRFGHGLPEKHNLLPEGVGISSWNQRHSKERVLFYLVSDFRIPTLRSLHTLRNYIYGNSWDSWPRVIYIQFV